MHPDFVDTHCHLHIEPLAGQIESVLQRAEEAGVRQWVTVGTTLEDSRVALALAHRYPKLRVAVGVHPHEVASVSDATYSALEVLSNDPMVVAIGEVGLDCFRSRHDLKGQCQVLRRFISLAQNRHLPLILHCREAYEPLLECLKASAQSPVQGVIHCASGPPDFIQRALEWGLHISFAGNVTFPSASALRELVKLVPDERLLIETDAPFLAPQPVRGKTNEPAYVVHTASLLAGLRGTTIETLGELTSRNARRLFRLPEIR